MVRRNLLEKACTIIIDKDNNNKYQPRPTQKDSYNLSQMRS